MIPAWQYAWFQVPHSSESALPILGSSAKEYWTQNALTIVYHKLEKLCYMPIKCSETYWAVNDSSGLSASSPRRKRLFVNIACTLHNACTVRQKCRPCKMRGSEWHLWSQSKSLISAELDHCDMKDGNHAFFQGPRVRTSSRKQTVLVGLVPFSLLIVEVEAI